MQVPQKSPADSKRALFKVKILPESMGAEFSQAAAAGRVGGGANQGYAAVSEERRRGGGKAGRRGHELEWK